MFCWRASYKLYKSVWILICYYLAYSLFMFAITPDAPVTFVSEELRIGSEYVLMFLVAPPQAVLGDVEGADVFASKRCGRCFITNNRGFLPMTEYDAIVVFGDKNVLYETEVAMEPGKRYLLETSNKCIKSKFNECPMEPRITSFDTKESFTLCSLCESLEQIKYNNKRKKNRFYKYTKHNA